MPDVPEIPPQPLPTKVEINQVKASTPDGRQVPMLRWDISHPAGTTVFFCDRSFAQQVMQILMGYLQNWPPELVIPSVDVAEVERALGHPNGRRG